MWIHDGMAWCFDDRRRRSGEVDFGSHWKLDGKEWPLYRISWIADTGELYAIEQGNFTEVGPDIDRLVYVFGTWLTRNAIEEHMAGWWEPDFRIWPFSRGFSPIGIVHLEHTGGAA